MPRHVKSYDAVPARDPVIIHQCAVLARIGAGGVKTQQRRSLTGLLDVETVSSTGQIERHVAADHGLESCRHAFVPVGRSLASASLK